MPIRRNLLERIIKEEYEKLLNEFVVPVGFSLSKWKQYQEKHNITNAEYHKEHPETKWKVVHGHKEGHIGEPLKGMENMSYQKATKAHAAIAMRTMKEFVEPPETETQPAQPSFNNKLSRVARTAGYDRTAQLKQSKDATGKEAQELSGVERSLIIDLENKIRQLAYIPGVDLIKVRSRIEQMLKVLYKSFEPQIKASQSQKSEPAPAATKAITEPVQSNQTNQPQAAAGSKI